MRLIRRLPYNRGCRTYMKRIETSLPGVYIIEPDVFDDERGFFFESYHRKKYDQLGIADEFVQDNHARSQQGTLRGLHYQLRRPQAKLCRVTAGEVLDVAVDIRRSSPQFGKWTAVRLTAENKRQIYVPADFAHGYLVLSPMAEFLYKCSDYYDPADQRTIAWNDPKLAIEWNVASPILSEKDRHARPLTQLGAEDLPP
jgi:dTDP-4-dehydrorhamnose 3,5-epimerase